MDHDDLQDAPMCAAADPDPRAPDFDVPHGATDCHGHVFYPPDRYPFPPDRSYTPPPAPLESYQALHRTLGVSRGVLIQPSIYGDDNSAMMNDVAALGENYKAVVVVRPEVSDAELDRLSVGRACGVRVNVLFRGGISWDDITVLAGRLADRGWHLQCLMDVTRIEDLAGRVAELPVPVVIDHMGHIDAGLGPDTPGFQALLKVMDTGRVWVKLSAPYRLTRQYRPPFDDVTPLARALVAARSDRLIWGSDWPHPSIATPMPNDGDLMNLLPLWVPDAGTRRRILVDNPEKLYGFASL